MIYLINSDSVLNPIYSLHYKDILSFSHTACNINYIGHALYNYCYKYIAVAGLILLVAMIGSIVLTVDFSYHEDNSIIIYNTTGTLEGKLTYVSYSPVERQNKHIFLYDNPK